MASFQALSNTSALVILFLHAIRDLIFFKIARDQPFSESIVPMKHYQKDQRVQSLMIEINRWLYLGEDYSVDSERTKTLVSVLRLVGEVLEDN